jgi:hypothetical protein
MLEPTLTYSCNVCKVMFHDCADGIKATVQSPFVCGDCPTMTFELILTKYGRDIAMHYVDLFTPRCPYCTACISNSVTERPILCTCGKDVSFGDVMVSYIKKGY